MKLKLFLFLLVTGIIYWCFPQSESLPETLPEKYERSHNHLVKSLQTVRLGEKYLSGL